MTVHTDVRGVRILGDGPAAVIAGLVLAGRGWRAALVQRARESPLDRRVDVLGATALPALFRAGLCRDRLAEFAQPCPGIWLCWGSEASSRDFLASPHGAAWAVERSALKRALRELADRAGVQILTATDLPHERSDDWRIDASGRHSEHSRDGADDRLIALVATATLAPTAGPIDRRLHVEAVEDAWVYAVLGAARQFCIGVVTDAEALAGRPASEMAQAAVSATQRIRILAQQAGAPLSFRPTPVTCRWRPVAVARRRLRIGDAQASLDPLAGRGLWNAVRTAEVVAVALDEQLAALHAIDRGSRRAYLQHRRERLDYYREGAAHFGSGFWTRRLAQAGAGTFGAVEDHAPGLSGGREGEAGQPYDYR